MNNIVSEIKNIIIQKGDKGNTLVILDKCSYNEEILNDNSKFSKLDIPAGKEINHIVNLEKRITSALKLFIDKEIIDKSTLLDQAFYTGQVKFIRKLAMDYHHFALFFQLLIHLPTN